MSAPKSAARPSTQPDLLTCREKRTREEMEGRRPHGSEEPAARRRRLSSSADVSSASHVSDDARSDARQSPPSESGSRTNRPQTSGLHLPPLRAARWRGDGLDFRRPIMSTTSSNTGFDAVIDLTEDEPASMSDNSPAPGLPQQLPQQRAAPNRTTRLPRFSREIIDLSDDTPQRRHRSPPRTAPVAIPESPDVEFVSARTIPGAPPLAQPHRSDPNHFAIDLTDDDIDIVEVRVGAGGINGGTPGQAGFRTRAERAEDALLFQQSQDMLRQRNRRRANELAIRRPRTFNPAPYLRQLGGAMREALGGFIDYGDRRIDLGIGLDYDAAAFDLGLEREPPPPPPPTYTAPSKAPEGFTRSPEEDEVLICPNCERELCSGSDDANKQVWIIKACGHAYCGECTLNRHSTKRRGKEPARLFGSALPPPFSKCTVQGCEKNTKSKSAMLQLFL